MARFFGPAGISALPVGIFMLLKSTLISIVTDPSGSHSIICSTTIKVRLMKASYVQLKTLLEWFDTPIDVEIVRYDPFVNFDV